MEWHTRCVYIPRVSMSDSNTPHSDYTIAYGNMTYSLDNCILVTTKGTLHSNNHQNFREMIVTECQ